MSNRLKNETSPYLLQHKENPIEWYPWCKEAFERAETEDKPIFLSIGYSSCHWCHVMAHESFDDLEIAELLNRHFISIKVDKEERPDIDSIYMSVSQAFTENGGWPNNIFMTPKQKPFFAGTYFPKTTSHGMLGLKEILIAIHKKWKSDRSTLMQQAEEIIAYLNEKDTTVQPADIKLAHLAIENFKRTYDKNNGGFGRAPKFPTPHILLFLFSYYEKYKDTESLDMAEHTLIQMYRGGIFDHIGFGFCRYSTDKKFLVPHFEKMLYDNALLILAYCKGYAITKKPLYLEIAEKTANYILQEMTAPEGCFYSAQDADSDGEEGKYYLFTPNEIIDVLGQKDGEKFNHHFDISEAGNFEAKNIPNLLNSDFTDKSFEKLLPRLANYRKKRYSLHLDDKILTSWNGLMIAAMCELYLASQKETYLNAAKKADTFIQNKLYVNDKLFVSFRTEKRGVIGFLDDYASYIFAQITLYKATFEDKYLERAKTLCTKVVYEFSDDENGFYLYGNDSEKLILRPKETYDGAIPSGNSLMSYNLVQLALITSDEKYEALAKKQLNFLATDASKHPSGCPMFLSALLKYNNQTIHINK